MNLQRLLLVLTALCLSPSLWATTYAYVGPPYTSKTDFTPPCGTGPCANFTLGQSISGQFTTAAPLPPNLPGKDVHASVTSYSFTDGINTYSSNNPNARFSIFIISTDAAGNVIGASSEVQFQLWQTGSNPHTSGDRLAVFDACNGHCGGDTVFNNGMCTSVGQGGNIDPDTCIAGSPDGSASRASAAPSSVGTWSIVAPPSGTTVAVEYYYADWNFYFVTSLASEIAALDGGAFGGVWKRTGQTFNVWSDSSNGALATYRFFSTGFSPRSSHFYTPYVNEYNSLTAGTAWEYEGIAFYVLLPDANGNCPAGTVVLYRLYNNGMGGAPNHRFTTSVVTFNAMKAAGYVFEGNGLTGAYACVPQ